MGSRSRRQYAAVGSGVVFGEGALNQSKVEPAGGVGRRHSGQDDGQSIDQALRQSRPGISSEAGCGRVSAANKTPICPMDQAAGTRS